MALCASRSRCGRPNRNGRPCRRCQPGSARVSTRPAAASTGTVTWSPRRPLLVAPGAGRSPALGPRRFKIVPHLHPAYAPDRRAHARCGCAFRHRPNPCASAQTQRHRAGRRLSAGAVQANRPAQPRLGSRDVRPPQSDRDTRAPGGCSNLSASLRLANSNKPARRPCATRVGDGGICAGCWSRATGSCRSIFFRHTN